LRQARLRLTALDKSFPDSASVDVLRGQIELASKRPDLAAAAFRSALDRHPADIEALSGLTQLDLNAGKSREAVARIENALQKGNASASLQMLAAKTYTVTKDLAKAETSLHAAIGQDPNRFDAYSMLGQIYAVQKRIPEGVKQFETILGRNPKSVGASTAIGVLWQVQGRKADAETAYERTLTIDPRASVASNNLAWLLVESDRNLDRALELAQTARQQHPEDVDVADTLGWIFVKKKLAMSAIPLLESSAKAKPNDPVIQYHLGMAYKLSGNKLDARRALGRALELNQAFTGSDEARQALAAL